MQNFVVPSLGRRCLQSRYPAKFQGFDQGFLKHPYHLRWGVETPFRRAEYQQEVGTMPSKSVGVALQGFHAAVLANNLAAALALAARKKVRQDKGAPGQDEKGDYVVNFAQAFAKMEQYGFALWTNTGKAFDAYLAKLVGLFALSHEKARPGRSAPGKLTNFNKRQHHMAYQSTL